ncbi:MAG: chromosome segregation protein SMC, partial [Planctomycetota bacterium]
TGIVGPNGCGKSNVVDAVRWVLGETRPTSMRGSGMTDVIFKGSASRPPMSVSEVTLILDNGGGVLEAYGAEVAITRRLYKSGEGEYLINGERVRLKDIKNLLFDTGMGSRGYSVLEQGKIDSVLSANPAERRAIFEEAAGISRYRQRRHEATLRLSRVEQDVERLDDVMGELGTRVRSLKIQAGKAERFLSARQEWTTERKRFLRHRLHGLEAELGSLVPEIERLQTELEELRDLRKECEQEVTLQERERSSVVAELDRVAAETGHLGGELRALDERRSQLGLRANASRAHAAEEGQRATAIATQLELRRLELEEMTRAQDALSAVVGEADDLRSTLGTRVREQGRLYKELRREVTEQNEVVLGKLHERTAGQNNLRHLEAAGAPAEERLARAVERLAGTEGVLAAVRAEAGQAREAAQLAEETLEASEALHVRLSGQSMELEQELGSCATARRTRELERAAALATIDSLLDREAEFAGLAEGARAVLEAVEAGEGPCPAAALSGILADHLSADLRLARALDAVLGQRAGALVVADPGVARRVLEWVAEGRRGQAAVIPRGGISAAPERAEPPSGAGLEGRLIDLIQVAPGLREPLESMLGDVLVVADLETACAYAEGGAAAERGVWRWVTPGGELVEPSGMLGGHRELTQGPVGRRASAADLERKVQDLEAQLEALDAGEKVLLATRAELAEALAAATQQREQAREERGALGGRLEACDVRLADQEAARRESEAERSRVQAELGELARDLEHARTGARSAEEAFAAENERLAELDRGRHDLEHERDRLAREDGQAQVEATRVRGELTALEQRRTDCVRRIGEEEHEIERAEKRAALHLQSAEESESESEGLAVDSAGVLEKRGVVEERLKELREFERSSGTRIAQVRARSEEVNSALDGLAETLSQRRLVEQRLDLSRTELLTRAHEELELEAHDLREDFEVDPELATEKDLSVLEARLGELRAQLDKLGPVNTEAVDELDGVQTRLDFLETQSGDLASARKSFNETIAKIDAESRRMFIETFDEVRVNFQRIFRQLFGGGRADVQLEEGLDVLDAGIEIFARPPGREMLSINLLSGGQRTMTALALLFAILEARPSPFCILDEVDAALDDANIDRFLGMLEGFLESTQFVIVTHNKGTMSACEALFGVTMQIKGVSRYVTVELDEVDDFAPEVTGRVRTGSDGGGGEPGKSAPSGASAREADSPLDPARADDETGEPVVEIVPAPPAPAVPATTTTGR